MRLRNIIAVAGAAAALASGPAMAQISDDVVKIGVIADMTGPYADIGGMGVVRAVELAVKDFGGTVLGKPIEVVSANYLSKVDIAASKAREWYDVDKVDLIIESSDSAAALAMLKIATEKKKPIVFAGSVSAMLTGKECTPFGIQWTYNTYALAAGTAGSLDRQGGDSWYFITADYAFGHSMQNDATTVIEKSGGKVLGSTVAPLGTADFSSFLIQAQASKAKVVGLANAGKDLQNAIQQAAEFGLTKNQTLAALLFYDSDIKGLGLQAAQGLQFTTAFYWDRTPETREFAKRFFEVQKAMPNQNQTAAYSATMHYLKAIAATRTDASEPVLKWMRDTPINDVFAKDGHIRVDGQMVHDMFLAEVKKPSESTGTWDMVRIKSTIPGNEAYKPLAASDCPLAKGS
ncbi:MAG: ABC transporter substrate-binding protein [Rhodopila sp.]|nr:ABC transporter substrate-binding protein [Rhodopila sp.]